MIDILLATFNGEKHLSSQIDSILSQTYCNWRLLIHDDGSNDKTLDIIDEYVKEYSEKIFLLDDGIIGLGARNNFSHLLSNTNAKYIMFCDQDDIWLPNKIEQTLKSMNAVERKNKGNLAIGIFTDQKIVGANLKTIATSAWAYQGNGPKVINDIMYLSLRNYITGCTLMINSQAKELSTPIHSDAIMHDWWIGLCILKNGGILHAINTPTILYRQHEDNEVGATKLNLKFILLRFLSLRSLVTDQLPIYRQAKAAGVDISPLGYFGLKIKILLGALLR